MKLSELLEALKPSQYRKFVKGWDKSRYASIFKKYTTDKKGYRLYIALKGDGKKSVLCPMAISKVVEEKGYEVEDYAAGIASKDNGKRKIKIGKLLADHPDLLKKFTNDPKRAGAKNAEYLVVISRHPYDIAGMSTDRGWRSCMNLIDGVNKHYVDADVKEGTLVAYLIKSDDKNINDPVCRVLIKPFIQIETKDVVLGIEDNVYGTSVAGFTDTVKDWVEEFNSKDQLDGVFQLNDKLYPDGAEDHPFKGEKYFGKTKEVMDNIGKNPKGIKELKNATPAMYARAACVNPAVLYDLHEPKFLVKVIDVLSDLKFDDDLVLGDPDAEPDYIEDGNGEESKMTLDDVVRAIDFKSDEVQVALVDCFGPKQINRFPKACDGAIKKLFRHNLGTVFSSVKHHVMNDVFWDTFIYVIKLKRKDSGGHWWVNLPSSLKTMYDYRIDIPEKYELELINLRPQAIIHIYQPSDAALKLSMKLDPTWLSDLVADTPKAVKDRTHTNKEYELQSYYQRFVPETAKKLLDRAKDLKIDTEEDK